MATITKTSTGTYMVRYRDPAGRSKSRTFPVRRQAEDFRLSIDVDLRTGDFIDPALGRRNLDTFAEAWRDAMATTPRTIDWYVSTYNTHVYPYFADRAVSSITRAEVRAWAVGITERGLSVAVRKGAVTTLSSLYKHIIEAGAVRTNPAARLGLPKPTGTTPSRTFLDVEQIETFADRVATRAGDALRGLIIRFVAYSGLRAGETWALRAADAIGGKAVVWRSASEHDDGGVVIQDTKTHESRRVPLPAQLAALVDRHAERQIARYGKDALLFTDRDGNVVRHRNWYKRNFVPARVDLGLTGLRFHDLRHSNAALLIKLGAHPKAIMSRLGHSSITVTLNTYGHLFPELETQLTAGLERLIAEVT